MDNRWIRITLHLSMFIFILLVSAGTILFGNGYSVLSSLTGYSNLVMKNLNYSLGFSLFWGYFSSTTWIFQFFMLLPNLIFNDPIISMKFDVIMIYSEYYILAYLLSNLFYKSFSHEITVPSGFNFIFIILMFINYDFMYTFTGQMLPALFGIPIFLYILIKSYRLYNGDDYKIKDYLKLSLALSMISMGDPRFFIWAFNAFMGSIIFSIIVRKNFIKSIKILIYPLLISLPIILFIYYVYVVGSFSFIYVSSRPLTFSEINSYTKSFPFYSYFQLLGMSWPSFIYSPPSILTFKGDINSLLTVGNPAAMIYPYDSIGYIWFALTFSWLSFAITSMIFFARKNERVHTISFIFLFILTIGTYFPLKQFVYWYISLVKLPVVGGIWGITDAIPNYFMWAIYPYVIFYISLMFVKLINGNRSDYNSLERIKNFNFLNRLKITFINRKILIIVILILLVAPNWQFFDNIYPGQYTPVISGNGISSNGPLQPVKMPDYAQVIYDYLSDNYNGSYNIVWPQAWGFAYKWSPRVTPWYQPGSSPPSGFFTYLDEIVDKNETYMLKPLMDIYGVRYFVIDNYSYLNKSPLLPNLTNSELTEFFENSPGIKIFYEHSPNIWVFEDPGASILNGYSKAYSIGSLSPLDVAYYFSYIQNTTPLLLENSTPDLLINNEDLNNCSGLFTYNFFSSIHKNDSLIDDNFNYSYLDGIYDLGNNWYFESLKNNGTLSANNETIILDSSQNTFTQLSYGNFLSPGHTAIYIPEGYGLNLTVSYNFLANNNASVGTSVWVTDSNYTKHGGWYVNGNNFIGTGNFKHVILNTIIKPGYTYFEVQINTNFKGSVVIKNINISYCYFRILNDHPLSIWPEFIDRDYSTNSSEAVMNISKFINYSYLDGIYDLGNNWYFESLKNNGTLSANNETIILDSSQNTFTQLSYGNFLSPGHTAIYIPEGYGLNLTVSYNFLANNNASVGTSVWVTDSNYTKHGGWYVNGNNFIGTGNFKHVILNTIIKPGYTYFEVQINTNFKGSVVIKNINISYCYFRIVKELNYQYKNFTVSENKNYSISLAYNGNGIVEINNERYYLNSLGNIMKFNKNIFTNNSVIKMEILNLSIGGMIITLGNDQYNNSYIYYRNYQY
ncbi:MAG: hypothetical protein ACP5U0_08655, partial [Caldisphaera sp.]